MPTSAPSTKILMVGDTPTLEDLTSVLSGAEKALWDKLLHLAGIAPLEVTYVTSWQGRLPKYAKWDETTLLFKAALKSTIAALRPSIVVPMGAFANFLMTGDQGIRDARGYLTEVDGVKVLPTHHPRTILADYSLRFPVIYDLRKVAANANSQSINRPQRRVHIVERVGDLHRLQEVLGESKQLTVDIETHMDLQQISTISFSPSLNDAYVIPILRKVPKGQDRSVWSEEDEAIVLAHIAKLLALPCEHIFHNALFDCSHLANNGIYATRVEDTMLMAHAQQPEQLKGLGFLASLATTERQWKKMRMRNKDEEKNEE